MTGEAAPAPAKAKREPPDPQQRLALAVERLTQEVRALREDVARVGGDAATARARVDALSLQVQVFTEQGGALLLRPVREG